VRAVEPEVKVTSGRHGVEALLQAYVDAVGPPPHGDQSFRTFYEHVLSAHCRCFGVSFDERTVPPDKREVLAQLQRVLRHEAELPYPTKGFLEAGLVVAQCPEEFRDLFDSLGDLNSFYRRVALELAAELWGDLGARTEAQLVAAGLDRSRMPVPDFRNM
jgi:hypothetical protein